MTVSQITASVESDNPAGVALTEAAARKVKTLIGQEERDDLRLRVAVTSGGCSGPRHQLFFDDSSLDGDRISTYDGFQVVVDQTSAPHLIGATIDFVDQAAGQGFTIENPNAQSSCGSCSCGGSAR